MGSNYTQMLLKALAAGAPPQTSQKQRRTPSTLASLTHRGAPIPIFAPDARNPRYATGCYGVATAPAEDLRKIYGYAPDMLRYYQGCAKVYHGFVKVVLRHHRQSHGWATAVQRFVPDMLRCYGNATDLLTDFQRLCCGFVHDLSRFDRLYLNKWPK